MVTYNFYSEYNIIISTNHYFTDTSLTIIYKPSHYYNIYFIIFIYFIILHYTNTSQTVLVNIMQRKLIVLIK